MFPILREYNAPPGKLQDEMESPGQSPIETVHPILTVIPAQAGIQKGRGFKI